MKNRVKIGERNIEFLPTRMLYIGSLQSLVFADVHIGVELALTEQGSFIPPIQYRKIKLSLLDTIKIKKPKRIIILGDLKHTFQKRTLQEHYEVLDLLETLSSLGKEIILIRGNHDTFIRGILQRYNVEMLDYLEWGGFLFIHGHKSPPETIPIENRFVIMGHIHPTATISDGVSRYRFPCFLLSDRSLILPALTPLLPGFDVIGRLMDLPEYESPLLGDLEKFKVFIVIDDREVLNLGPIKLLRRMTNIIP